ncbi:MAG: AsmA family protein, partial [Pseudomonadota bacterium]
LSGTLGPIAALLDPKKAWPLKMTAKAFDATVNLEGSIKDALSQSGIDLVFKVQVKDWTKLSELAGQPIPIKDALELSGRAADAGPKAYKVSDLKVTLGSFAVAGHVGVNLSKKVPYLDVALSSQTLDLRPLFPKEGGKEASKAKAGTPKEKPKKVFPDDPLPLDGLRQVDGIIKIKVGRLLLPRLAVNDLDVETSMKGGELNLKPLKATIGGGALNGSIALIPRGKAADLAALLKIDGFELGKMLKELGITDLIEGSLDVDVDLKGQGTSVASLMAGLNGHTSVIMSKGRVNNKYIDLLGGDISSSVLRLLDPTTEKKDYTAIRCLVSRFDIKKGLADTTALVVDTDRMSVVGEGEIDLRTEKLDLALKPLPKEGVGGMSLSLGELAKPFKLGGTLAEPGLAVDPTAAALALGKSIGGVIAFGPAGIAAALVGKGGGGDENPCLAAIQAAKAGVKAPRSSKKSTTESTGKKDSKSPAEGLPDVGKALKGLFGR